MFRVVNIIGHNNYNLSTPPSSVRLRTLAGNIMESSRNSGLVVLLHAVFFVSGITTVLIGQVLPVLSAAFALNDLQAGYFFPAQFSGSIIGTIVSSWFGKRNNFVLAATLGSVAMAIGVTAMTLSSFSGCLAGFLINGVGVGLTLPSINMLILEMNPHRGAAALSLLNFCWGLGAIACKPFVDATSTRTSILLTSLVLAIPQMIAAALITFLPRPSGQTALPRQTVDTPAAVPIWATGIAWTIALFNFVHVGFESGIGGWLTTYAERLHGNPVTELFSPTFLYFLSFVAGRGLAPILFRYLSEDRVLFLDLGIMAVGMALILSAPGLGWLSLGAAVTGLGSSSVFPTNLSRFTRVFGPTATRRATPLFVCGTLGGATVTWLIGFVSNSTGTLHSGMFSLIACVVVLLIVQAFLAFLPGRSEPVGSQ